MVRATFAGITTALSSLQANQKRLDIVGQNLSNMSTPGYTRQQLDVSSLNHLSPVSHYANGAEINVGFGVKMDGVSRIRDPYLDVQYRDQVGKSGYNETMQTSLDTLSKFLDEHTIAGIRQAFDDVQSVLTNTQDPSKVHDEIFNSELRARMQALTNALNDAAQKIEKAEKQEYEFLDGTGTSENGAIDKVNDLLKQIGDLNVQIKRNQIVDQPSLELMDERDMLLDELASLIPIEVTYYKDPDHSTWEDWPYDLRVDMLYQDANGVDQRLTLVEGSLGGRGNNYGSVTVEMGGANKDDPTGTSLTFTEASSAITKAPADPVITAGGTAQFATGSIQASLDMLGQKGTGAVNDDVRGYQYYMKELDTLAETFVNTINDINNKSVEYSKNQDGNLLSGTTAKDIAVSDEWIAGTIKVGTVQVDANGNPNTDDPGANDTILEMLKAFQSNSHQPLQNKSFTGFMNHISTVLATDSYMNNQELKTNVTVLNGIQDSRDSISAVSLDEEASNMMAFLNAYNAASRLMTTLDEALNTLINNTGLVGR